MAGDFKSVDDAPPPSRPTIAELFTRLANDATAYVRAEVAVYRAEAGQKLVSAGWIIALFVAAIALAQGALIALLIGLVMALAKPLGIWWALLVVVFGALAVAGLLIWIGSNQAARLTRGERKS